MSDLPSTRPSSRMRMLLALPRIARLCWRLFWDRRVPLLRKAIPLAAILYVLLPFDLLPDAIPGLGQLDDLTLLVAAAYAFVRACPPALVVEHGEPGGR